MVAARKRLSSLHRPSARAADERGQALILSIVTLAILMGFTGLVIDIGRAYVTQRKIQSSADAAVLAGAQQLPDSNAAVATARSYSGAPGAKNSDPDIAVTTSATTRCLSTVPGCSPVNAVSIDESATVDTSFLRVFGVNSLNVHVKSTACSPCGTKPLDIMLVLDRTGSMCQDHYGNNDPYCTDLNNAKAGMKTFLTFFDPSIQFVGLAVLPPATNLNQKCSAGSTNAYNSQSSPYVLVPLSNDYKLKSGSLNTASNLVSTINCVQGGGRTSYATALEAAKAELNKDGRSDVQDVVVFLSDGAANLGPNWYTPASSSPYIWTPCHQGVTSANAMKSTTIIYSIGYDLDASGGGANTCTATNNTVERNITAYQALQGIASNPGNFYNQPNPGQLNTIFTQVAADLSHGSARLIDNNTN